MMAQVIVVSVGPMDRVIQNISWPPPTRFPRDFIPVCARHVKQTARRRPVAAALALRPVLTRTTSGRMMSSVGWPDGLHVPGRAAARVEGVRLLAAQAGA